jgi:hypothetical protein
MVPESVFPGVKYLCQRAKFSAYKYRDGILLSLMYSQRTLRLQKCTASPVSTQGIVTTPTARLVEN